MFFKIHAARFDILFNAVTFKQF